MSWYHRRGLREAADIQDDDAAEPGHSAGDTVAGYRLERPLGQGGMADVWLGRSANGSLAAIKLLRSSTTVATKRLFEREKRALLRIQHPNLVAVFDVGERYIVSAYIEGADLRHRMRSPIPVKEAVDIVCEIASALAVVHASGVVHCDIKPANILLDHGGTPYLADFGIATFVDDVSDTDGLVQGTPAYMAPEQRRGVSSPRSDQYALAKTLLIMLGGPTQLAAEEAIQALPPAYEKIGEILRTSLATAPEERYANVAEMAAALREVKLEDTETTTRLAALRRDTKDFGWTRGHHKLHRFGMHIVRADYRLSDLESAGLLDAERVAEFRKETGCVDFGWSMYARDERLGPVNEPEALGRAKQTVVFLHGLFTNREVWKDVAVGISRDNGTAVVLTPDLPGFGVSMLGKKLPRAALSPKGVVRSMNAWLKLLAIGDTPTAVVGHSYSAASLMCATEAELGDGVHSICITPAFFFYTWRLRLKTRFDSFLATAIFALPNMIARPVARFAFRRDPSLNLVNTKSCDDMAESALRIGGARVGKLFRAVASARPAPPHELRRCTVVTTPDDPLVSAELAERSIVNAGVPEAQWYRLIYGGHFPQLVDEAHPEWGARNVHELVSLIDGVLDKARVTKRKEKRNGSSKNSSDSEGRSSSASLQRSTKETAEIAEVDDVTVQL